MADDLRDVIEDAVGAEPVTPTDPLTKEVPSLKKQAEDLLRTFKAPSTPSPKGSVPAPTPVPPSPPPPNPLVKEAEDLLKRYSSPSLPSGAPTPSTPPPAPQTPAPEWADPDYFTPPDRKGYGEAFIDALVRGAANVAQAVPTIQGALAEYSGDQEAAEQYYTKAKAWEEGLPEAVVQRFSDVKTVEDFSYWLTEATGEQIPLIAAVAAGAYLGRAALPLLPIAATAARSGLMSARGAQAFAERLGAVAGGYAVGAPLEGAETAFELKTATGSFHPELSAGAGAVKGLLEIYTPLRLIDRVTGRAASQQFGRALFRTALGEGATETVQEEVSIAARKYADPSYDYFGSEALYRRVDAAAAGFFVGGIFGGAGEALGRVADRRRPEKVEEVEDRNAFPSPISYLKRMLPFLRTEREDVLLELKKANPYLDPLELSVLLETYGKNWAGSGLTLANQQAFADWMERNTDRYVIKTNEGYSRTAFSATDLERVVGSSFPSGTNIAQSVFKVNQKTMVPAGVTAEIRDLQSPSENIQGRVWFLPTVPKSNRIELLSELYSFMSAPATKDAINAYITTGKEIPPIVMQEYNTLVSKGLRVLPSLGASFYYSGAAEVSAISQLPKTQRSLRVLESNRPGKAFVFLPSVYKKAEAEVAVDLGRLSTNEYLPIGSHVDANLKKLYKVPPEHEKAFDAALEKFKKSTHSTTDLEKFISTALALGVEGKTIDPTYTYAILKEAVSRALVPGFKYETNMAYRSLEEKPPATTKRKSKVIIREPAFDTLAVKRLITIADDLVQASNRFLEKRGLPPIGDLYIEKGDPNGAWNYKTFNIEISTSMDSTFPDFLNTYLHELGHHITYNTFRTLPTSTKELVYAAYRRDTLADSLQPAPYNTARSRATGVQVNPLSLSTIGSVSYVTQFTEWLPENFIKWITSPDRPQSLKEEMFVANTNVLLEVRERIIEYAKRHYPNAPEMDLHNRLTPAYEFSKYLEALLQTEQQTTPALEHRNSVVSPLAAQVKPLAAIRLTDGRIIEGASHVLALTEANLSNTELAQAENGWMVHGRFLSIPEVEATYGEGSIEALTAIQLGQRIIQVPDGGLRVLRHEESVPDGAVLVASQGEFTAEARRESPDPLARPIRSILDKLDELPNNPVVEDFGAAINEAMRAIEPLLPAGWRVETGQLPEGEISVAIPSRKTIIIGLGAMQYGVGNILMHETVHAVRAAGLFTDREWKTLVDETRRDRRLWATVRQNWTHHYMKQGRELAELHGITENKEGWIQAFVQDRLEEEAVAVTTGLRYIGAEFSPQANGLLDRLLQFLSKLKEILFTRGYISPKDVRKALFRGEITARERARDRMPEMELEFPGFQQMMADMADDRRKGQEVKRVLDKLGFYSRLLESAQKLRQEKGTPEQMLSQLKGPNWKAEAEATGLEDFLKGKKNVTKQEIVKYLTEAQVKLEQKHEPTSIQESTVPGVFEVKTPSGKLIATFEKRADGLYHTVDYRRPAVRVTTFKTYEEVVAQFKTDTLYRNYTLDPDSPTYEETVLYLPPKPDPEYRKDTFRKGHFKEPNVVAFTLSSVMKHKGENAWVVHQLQSDWATLIRVKGIASEDRLNRVLAQLEEARRNYTDARLRYHLSAEGQKALADARALLAKYEQPVFNHNDSGKFKEYDDVADSLWYLINVAVLSRKDEQKRNELLSKVDLRSPELMRTEVPPALRAHRAEIRRLQHEVILASTAITAFHPLVRNTDQYVNLMLSRTVTQAVEAGVKYIVIPHGETVRSYNPGDEEGMAAFYGSPEKEGIVPRNLQKLLQMFDPAVTGTKIKNIKKMNGEDAFKRPRWFQRSKKVEYNISGIGFTVFEITDKIREGVRAQGFPLFAMGPPLRTHMNPTVVEQVQKDLWVTAAIKQDSAIFYFNKPPQDGRVTKPTKYEQQFELGEPVGWVTLTRNSKGFEVDMVRAYVTTYAKERRHESWSKSFYDYIEKKLNIKMSPSGQLTPEGYAMWQKRSPIETRYHQYSEVDHMWFSPNYIRDRLKYWTGELGRAGPAETAFKQVTKANYRKWKRLYDKVPSTVWSDPDLERMFHLDAKGYVRGVGQAMFEQERRTKEQYITGEVVPPIGFDEALQDARTESKQRNAKQLKLPYTMAASEQIETLPMRRLLRWRQMSAAQRAQLSGLANEADRIGRFSRQWWGIQQLMQVNPHFERGRYYLQIVEQWMAYKQYWINRAGQIAHSWDRLPRVQRDALADYLFYMNDMQYLSRRERNTKVVRRPSFAEQQQAVKRFNLSGNTFILAREVDKLFAEYLTEFETISTAHIKQTFAANPIGLQDALKKLQADMVQLRAKPYFPMTRFGVWTITVRHFNTRKLEAFYTFETQAERNEYISIAKQRFPLSTIQAGKMPEELQEFAALPGPMLRRIKAELPGITPVQQQWLDNFEHLAAPDNSFRKHWLKRRGTPGYSLDAFRVFTNYFMLGSGYMARLKYRDAAQEQVTRAGAEATMLADSTKRIQIVEEMQQHLNYLLEPTRDWAKLKAFAAVWYLGFSPVAAAMNLMQMPVVTIPYLTRLFGAKAVKVSFAQGANALYQTAGSYSKNIFYPGYTAAREEMIRQGKVDAGQAYELSSYMHNNNMVQMIAGNVGQRYAREFLSSSMAMFRAIERYNRELTFTTAFILAMEAQTKKGKNKYLNTLIVQEAAQILTLQTKLNITSEEAIATVAAKQAIDRTHYIYDPYARPKFMRQPLLNSLLIFYQYTQATLFHFRHNPGGVYSLFMMAFLYGVMGLPGAEDLDKVIEAIARRFFGKDFSIQKAAREYIRMVTQGTPFDKIGPDLALHGTSKFGFGLGMLPDGWGAPRIDLHANGSMGNILPVLPDVIKGWGHYANAKEVMGEALQKSAGAGHGYFFALLQFLASEPHTANQKKWELIMQREMKAIARGTRYAVEGKETDKKGATIAQFDITDPDDRSTILMQFLGFTPSKVSTKQQQLTHARESEQYFKGWRLSIYTAIDEAIRKDHPQTLQKIIEHDIPKFNREAERVGFAPINKAQDLISSIRGRARSRVRTEEGLPQQRGNTPGYRRIQDMYPLIEQKKVK